VTDPADERLADYRALTDVELRTAFEPPHGLFIAEGELVLRRAVRAGYRMRSVLLDVRRLDQLADLLAKLPGVPVYTADQRVLERLTGCHVHRGILGSVHRRQLPPAVPVLAAARSVLCLEDVNNHTNLEGRKPSRPAWKSRLLFGAVGLLPPDASAPAGHGVERLSGCRWRSGPASLAVTTNSCGPARVGGVGRRRHRDDEQRRGDLAGRDCWAFVAAVPAANAAVSSAR
jgi:hypothetical protein